MDFLCVYHAHRPFGFWLLFEKARPTTKGSLGSITSSGVFQINTIHTLSHTGSVREKYGNSKPAHPHCGHHVRKKPNANHCMSTIEEVLTIWPDRSGSLVQFFCYISVPLDWLAIIQDYYGMCHK